MAGRLLTDSGVIFGALHDLGRHRTISTAPRAVVIRRICVRVAVFGAGWRFEVLQGIRIECVVVVGQDKVVIGVEVDLEVVAVGGQGNVT